MPQDKKDAKNSNKGKIIKPCLKRTNGYFYFNSKKHMMLYRRRRRPNVHGNEEKIRCQTRGRK